MDERALPMMIGGSMTAEIITIVMVGVALAGVGQGSGCGKSPR